MLLTHTQLINIAQKGVIVTSDKFKQIDLDHINGASIDITLGDSIMIESETGGTVDLAAKQIPCMRKITISDYGYELMPGEFILASSDEFFFLPNHIAFEYKLKSSLARAGLNHLLAGWADPGWHGSQLTLELQNVTRHHRLLLRKGMKIGQIVFWQGPEVPDDASYANRGQYNKQVGVTESKGLR